MADKIPCFAKVNIPDLAKLFDSKYKEGMSEAEQRQIGTDIALDYHKKLFEELNTFKEKDLKIKLTKEQKTYVSPDKSEAIKKITDDYQKQIDEANTPIPEPIKAEEKPQPEKTLVEDKQGAGKEPPIEPPKKEGVGGENKETAGITHAANEVRRQDRALPEYQKEPQSFEQWNNEAEKAIKDGYDVEKLIGEIEGGKDPNPVENAIRKIYVATLDAEIAKTPTDALLAKQKRFIEAGDLANSRAGRNLVSLKGEGSPLSTISDFYVAKMEAAGVDKLTEQQKKETKEAFDKVQKADENATAAMEAYREEIAKLKAENELLRSKKTTTTNKTKRTHDDYVKERDTFRERLKEAKEKHEKWLKEQGIQKSGFGFTLTGEMVKEIKNIVKSHVEENVSKLQDVISKVLEDIKDIFPEITDKDIRDVIAGEYNEKKPTRNELAAKMRDLKDEAYYINKLERLLNGTEPKNEKQKVERNRQITELKKKITDFNKEEAEANKFYGESDAAQRRIEAKEDELQRLKERKPKETKPEKVKEASEKEKQLNEEIAEERKKIKAEEAEANKFYAEELSADAKKLSAIKKRNQTQEAKIKERIRTGDFETKKKVPLLEDPELKKKFPKLWKDAADALVKKDEARHDFDIALFKDQMARRTKTEKFTDLLGKASGTVKAITTGIDDSAVAIQTYMSMLRRPRTGARAFARHIEHAFSQKKFDRWLAVLHNSPDFQFMRDAGLDVTEPSSLKAKEKEEIFDKRFNGTVKIKGKEYKLIDAPLKPFERAFTTLGNVTRVVGFRKISEKYMKEGYTWEKHPELFKSLATRLNTETGRGKQNEYIENASKVVTLGIWSPRLMAMKFNILGVSDAASLFIPGTKGYYRQLHPKERLAAVRDIAQFATTVMALSYGFALAFGGDVDDDPFSSTFMDVKMPNGKSYNFTGGFSSYIRAITQYVSGKKSRDGKMGDAPRNNTASRFFRGKVPPLTGAALNLASGKNFMGEKTSVADEAVNLLPISVRGIAQQIERDGATSFFTQGIPTFFGLNIKDERDYQFGRSPLSEEELKDPTFKLFSEKGINFPEFNPEKIQTKEVNGKVTEHLSDYPKDQQDKYIDAKKKAFKEELKSLKNGDYEVYRDENGTVHIRSENTDVSEMEEVRFKDLTPEDIQYLIGTHLSGNATRKAKEEVELKMNKK